MIVDNLKEKKPEAKVSMVDSKQSEWILIANISVAA